VLDVTTLKGWLWDAACQIRGPLDAPKFKDYILPLISLKRLSDVFDDELDRLTGEFGDRETAAALVADDHGLVRFYVPPAARWQEISRRTTGLGEYLTDAVRGVARENPRLQGVIDMVDFNATASGQRTVDDGRLAALIGVLGRHRLGLRDVEPDILGRAYEYLLRKFAEGQGQSAGEFYTPPEVAWVMARVLDPDITPLIDPYLLRLAWHLGQESFRLAVLPLLVVGRSWSRMRRLRPTLRNGIFPPSRSLMTNGRDIPRRSAASWAVSLHGLGNLGGCCFWRVGRRQRRWQAMSSRPD
jgi:HsdM N-terminal domain/N-6 DNA Methylase